jgi:predicted HAD superfamily Cof-like phosphohydrolase
MSDKERIEELETEVKELNVELNNVIDEDNQVIGNAIKVIDELRAENAELKEKLSNMRTSPYILVKEFHETYNMPIRDVPVLDIPARKMRLGLIMEEALEYAEAEGKDDFIEMADALADIVYVAYGAALEHGIDLDHVLEEVQRSNLSKLHHETGLPIYREDGKVLKGENFTPPNIEDVLKQQGWVKE